MHSTAGAVLSGGAGGSFQGIGLEVKVFDTAFVGSTDHSPVDLMGVRCSSVNVGASVNFGKSPGSPN